MASGQVYYIDCDDGDENIHFEVSRICVTLSKLQFTIITRLKCYGNMTINYSKLGAYIQDKNFISNYKSTKTVKREIGELMFEKLHDYDGEDAVKMALVYLVSHVILFNAKTIGVSDIVFHLANDLNVFNDYPRGNLVWDEMRKNLLKETTNAKVNIEKGSNCYHLIGFPIVLVRT